MKRHRSKKKQIIYLLIIIAIAIVTTYFKKREEAPKTERLAKPTSGAFNYLPTTKSGKIVEHHYFTLSYVEKHEQAEWVAYELTKDRTVTNEASRSDDFRPDPDVPSGSATPEDYSNSGYDRGHLAPAGDMGFSKKAMSETFYMSNMSPQDQAFNRGIWKHLEEQVRKWSVQNGKIYVVTGGVLSDDLPKMRSTKVSIPKYFYKVILDYQQPDIKAIAFLIPNERVKKPLSAFVVPIDSVEELTGIDFFPDLPDDLENEVEKSIDLKQWSKKK